MLVILNLCHNSFSSFHRLLQYIKYRITGGVSLIAIEDPNLLELCAPERKFQCRASLCNVQGFQKYLLCIVYVALCIRQSRLKTLPRSAKMTRIELALSLSLFQACKWTPRPLLLLSLCCTQQSLRDRFLVLVVLWGIARLV